MNSMIPQIILDQYNLGQVHSIERISSGLVHTTFRITSDSGDFVIQKLHSILSSQEIADDFLLVTSFLNNQGFSAPKCILTKNGNVLSFEENQAWRMQTAILGQSYDRIDDLNMIEQAGKMLGRFHFAIAKLPSQLKSTFALPPNPGVVFQKFEQVINNKKSSLPEVDFIMSAFAKLFLPNDLPQQIIHGDPKVSNFLFLNNICVGLIDLDTCNRQSVLMELGDAFRSWCGGKEDDEANTFSLEKFKAGWKGYQTGAGNLLGNEERKLLPQAIRLVTLELACRFLTDYFEDCYFGWDEKRFASRQEHNLARCRGQIAEFKDLELKRSLILDLV